MEKGANPNQLNSRKKTPIDIAHNKGNKKILEILEG